MNVALSHFGGIIPRLAEHMLGPNQATLAHDVKLRNGQLEAWHTPKAFQPSVRGARAFYLYGCCLLSWADTVTCTELAPDWNRIYLTGRGGRGLEVGELNGCEADYILAGVPAPTAPLWVDANETCGMEADARSYVYTYVNRWGEESAPSPPSNIVRVNDGDAVQITSGVPNPPDGYGVVEANIYRGATGFRPPDGKVQTPMTEYLYVMTVSVPGGDVSFQDNIQGRLLGAALETQKDRMPPDGMQGVANIGDQIRLAGFKDNKIFMSEAFQPHNWPAKYDLTLDYNIVHLLALDQRLFVTTTGTPYIIDVSNCDATKCTPVTSIDYPLADIGCAYPHSAIMTFHGLLYATQHGITLLQPNGEWHILTTKWFGVDEWRKLKPQTLRMAYWEGYLFFATDVATFLLDINGGVFGNALGSELVTLSDRPVDMLASGTGRLLFLQDNMVWEWDAGKEYRPYLWQSRPLTSGDDAVGGERAPSLQRDATGQRALAVQNPARASKWWPTSVKLGGNADFTLFDDHEHEVFKRFIPKETPRRLPRCGRHLWYYARLNGIDTVRFLDVGTSVFTVNSGG